MDGNSTIESSSPTHSTEDLYFENTASDQGSIFGKSHTEYLAKMLHLSIAKAQFKENGPISPHDFSRIDPLDIEISQDHPFHQL